MQRDPAGLEQLAVAVQIADVVGQDVRVGLAGIERDRLTTAQRDHLQRLELAAAGANSSLIHVDWMIGSAAMDIDGMLPDGKVEPLIRKGDWV